MTPNSFAQGFPLKIGWDFNVRPFFQIVCGSICIRFVHKLTNQWENQEFVNDRRGDTSKAHNTETTYMTTLIELNKVYKF